MRRRRNDDVGLAILIIMVIAIFAVVIYLFAEFAPTELKDWIYDNIYLIVLFLIYIDYRTKKD